MKFIIWILLFIFSLPGISGCIDQLKEVIGNPHRIESLIGGAEINQRLTEIISSAKSSIEIQVSSVTENTVLDILKTKAREGVSVKIILPELKRMNRTNAQREQIQRTIAGLMELGVLVEQYPMQEISLGTNVFNPEIHKKLIIIDKETAYIGNKNLNREHSALEFGVLIQGPSVKQLQNLFLRDMADITKDARLLNEIGPIVQSSKIKFLNRRENIQEILSELAKAEKSITIAHREIDDQRIVDALINKKRNNPNFEIEILTAESTHPLSRIQIGGEVVERSVNYRLLNQLKGSGVNIKYLEMGSAYNFFHGKLVILDEKRVIMGSSDLNARGLEGNLELDLSFESSLLANEFLSSLRTLNTSPASVRTIPIAQKITSEIYHIVMKVILEVNKIKMKTLDKINPIQEFFPILASRTYGLIYQFYKKTFSLPSMIQIKSLEQLLSPFQSRIRNSTITLEEIKQEPLGEYVYLFIGGSSYHLNRIEQLGFEKTFNGAFGEGIYLSTSIETSINYARLRTRQMENLRPGTSVDPSINIYRLPLSQVEQNRVLFGVDGPGRDYIFIQDTQDSNHLELLGRIILSD